MDYKVLVVEDDKSIREYLQMELAHEGCKVTIAADGREALDKALNNSFDIMLLDIMLPYVNGVEVCRKIREKSAVPIIMLTAKGDVSDKVLGLDSGANDYLTKPFEIEELFARMRAATRALGQAETNCLSCKNLTMSMDTHTVTVGENEVTLTKREFDLLEQFLLNKNLVLSRDKLLQNVWEYDYIGDSNVVDVTVKNLRTKLGDKDGELISTVRGYGYAMKE
ncbi:MAG: response regulator transcription factor [Oscillospiraceae bacterium]